MAQTSTIEVSNPVLVESVSAKDFIRRIVEQAEANHGFICISGYRSETGAIRNYVLQPYGPHGYIRLVQESLDVLNRNELSFPPVVWGEHIPDNIWEQARLEQMESFRKTLNGEQNRVNRKVLINKSFYELDGSIYVANVRIVKVHETPEQAEHNRNIESVSIPVSPLAKAKKWIRDNTPVGHFRGQFRLDPDKFERIAWSHRVIEVDEMSKYIEFFTPSGEKKG